MLRQTAVVALLLGAAAVGPGTGAAEGPARAAAGPDPASRREVGNLVIEGIPEIPAGLAERLLQYQNTRYATLYGWLGEGLLIGTRFGESNQVHYVDRPGGARQQLTFFAEPVQSAAPSPEATRRRLLFTRDVGGSEFYQVYRFDLETGRTHLLTDGKARHGAVIWSRSGDRFAYYSTARNGRDWDVCVADADDPAGARRVLEAGGVWYPISWSPDDRRLLLIKYVSIAESHCYVLDPALGDLTEVNPASGPVAYEDAEWSGDGRGLFLASDEGTEFRTLRYWDLAAGTMEDLSGDIPWDVEDIEVSPRGDAVA
ncbi:MAG: S9 family peptidase, partial [Gemmatimonadota bacterium]